VTVSSNPPSHYHETDETRSNHHPTIASVKIPMLGNSRRIRRDYNKQETKQRIQEGFNFIPNEKTKEV